MYCIQEKKACTRGSIEHGAPPVMQWVTRSYWGSFPTRLAAMRRYVEEMDPGFAGAPDSLIRMQWKGWARSSGLRTVRLEAEGTP
jgi:hypothetical protein